MGIHGLTTYLHENKAVIAKYLHFTPATSNTVTPFVIDGLSGLPWVYGGEYGDLSRIVERTVRAWLQVGLRLYFVFDGPYPLVKFPTLTSRATKTTIQGSKLFFVTSPAARSKPRFLREIEIIPPSAYTACIETLKDIVASLGDKPSLEIHFADEEGDPYAVELAGRLGGYVLGKDSDFVVLNVEGYKGYIPLDEMVWTSLSQDKDLQDTADDDDGFQTVVNTKAKKKSISKRAKSGNGIVPPQNTDDIELSVTVYSPAVVASQLRIPVSLLPLLGALVGNDFTGSKDPSSTTVQESNLQRLFFERQLTLSQRITRVANTLHNILEAALSPSARGKQKLQVNSVMQLIERAITTLLIRSSDMMPTSEQERIMDRIVEATLQYAIPRYEGELHGADGLWASPVCALHEEEACPLIRYLSPPPLLDIFPISHEESRKQKHQEAVRNIYVSAYRAGRLDPRLLDTMNSGTFWYRQMLEHPDTETVNVSIGRPIQQISYALLDDALGLPEKPEEEEEEEEDDDEVIDVVEESDEDYLAPLRGALQELDTPADSDDEMATEPPTSLSSHAKSSRPSRPKVIQEHIRRGVRLADEEVSVPALSEVLAYHDLDHIDHLPLQLASEDDRLTFFLRVLQSDAPPVRGLHPEDTLVVLALRWVVSRLHARAQASAGSKERVKERWTKPEARAFLASFSPPGSSPEDSEDLPMENRNIQLVAQISAAFAAIERLSQLLLLSERFQTPVLRFSGKLFHSYLTGFIPIPPKAVPSDLWDASVEGLEHAFGEPMGKKKKGAKGAPVSGPPQPSKKQQRGAVTGGMFGLLGDIEA
ncbi:unnamed protein product [Somion occarium]|uniref:Asteroid domain-containing protein n=1 Tax=Somion occarium TaxID=3059160 RepID=A0ABP1DW00_9APHY